MHARLEELYESWVCFHKKANWTNRQSLSSEDYGLSSASAFAENSSGKQSIYGAKPIPSLTYRIVVGSFYQPLDSIEQVRQVIIIEIKIASIRDSKMIFCESILERRLLSILLGHNIAHCI